MSLIILLFFSLIILNFHWPPVAFEVSEKKNSIKPNYSPVGMLPKMVIFWLLSNIILFIWLTLSIWVLFVIFYSSLFFKNLYLSLKIPKQF